MSGLMTPSDTGKGSLLVCFSIERALFRCFRSNLMMAV